MARKTKRIRQKNQFTIITNGKETEKNYFEKLKSFRHSIYQVKVKFVNADPFALVDRAVQEKQTSNQVWVIFDKDRFSKDSIYRAIQIANKNGIGIAFSNISFEVWLIAHFMEINSEKNVDELISILDSYLKGRNYTKGYEKRDAMAFQEHFFPMLDIAVQNADISLQKRIAEFNINHPGVKSYPYCDWNSCTTVHKLVMALKLKKAGTK